MRRFIGLVASSLLAQAFSFRENPAFHSAPPIVPIHWDRQLRNIPVCITDQSLSSLHAHAITTLSRNAIDNINIQMSSGLSQPLAFYIDGICHDNSLQIKLVNDTTNDLSVAYCTRNIDFSNYPLYRGCNITMNICALQNAATFYNVLLHELLHVVGLDHPEPPDKDAVISHGVVTTSPEGDQFRRQDNYISLTHVDKLGIQKILMRDFSVYSFPYSPYNIHSSIHPLLSLVERKDKKMLSDSIISVKNCFV